MTTHSRRLPPFEQVHATYWLLRMVVGLGPVLVGIDELTTRVGSVVHRGVALPQEISTALALVEIAAGLAVVAGLVRFAAPIVGALFAVLAMSVIGAESALALKLATFVVCAFGLVRLEGVVRAPRAPAVGDREVKA